MLTLRKFARMALCAATLFASASNVNAALVITEVMSNSGHPGGSGNGDWWELTNTGPGSAVLTGWSWDDTDNIMGTHPFPNGTTIAAGESILIVDESNETAWKSAWGLGAGVQVLNSTEMGGAFSGLTATGDEIRLYNGVSQQLLLAFGAQSSGFSLEWDTSGASLAASVAGQNGAYVAINNGVTPTPGAGTDVASPGVAVPEPTSIGLACLVLPMLAARRRRA